MKYLLLFLLLICSLATKAQNELKPLFDKSLLEITPLSNPTFQFEEIPCYIDKLKLKTDFDFFEPYIQQGMMIVDFKKIPINEAASSQQIYTIKHPSGRIFTVINRMPGFPYSETFNSEIHYGTSVGFDFNKLIYYAFHPGAKAQQKRTALKRTQITCFVYTND